MQMLTVKDVAFQLRISELTARRLIAKGDLTFKKIGGQLRMTQDDLLLQIDKMQIPKEPVKRRTRRTEPKMTFLPTKYVNGQPRYL